ncbi:MAG: glycosyltransferase [Acidobacteriota bacterium]|nr:glycosyltransferase [Acidobacteriota bacterium]
MAAADQTPHSVPTRFMMTDALRVALFPDSYHEANGVARTFRALVGVARRRGLPLLIVRCGNTAGPQTDGSVNAIELQRGGWSFPLDADLSFDLWLWRYARKVREQVQAFQPQVVHVTGPSDIGQLGVYVAKSLHLPLVMSWHTNLHEYAGQRCSRLLDYAFVPSLVREQTSLWAETQSLWATMKFYEYADVCLAPNPELVELVAQKTGKPTYLMQRGIDAEAFHPNYRTRPLDAPVVRLGFVGRLSAEKNVRFLVELERQLLAQGLTQIEFRIVGTGSERDWLAAAMQTASFAGVQQGEALAREYADFDVFVFPSRTDTYGNVVLEAAASGVPCVVTSAGGPKFLVDHGRSGLVAHNDAAFVAAVADLVRSPERRAAMRTAARARALQTSWDAVLDEVYTAYQAAYATAKAIG